MARPIIETLRHIEGGCFLDDAAEQLAALVLAVSESGKSGKLTMTIDLRQATAGALAVTGKVVVKKPAQRPVEALLFATPEGNLLSEDPRQQKLELRSVEQAPTEFKTVSA